MGGLGYGIEEKWLAADEAATNICKGTKMARLRHWLQADDTCHPLLDTNCALACSSLSSDFLGHRDDYFVSFPDTSSKAQFTPRKTQLTADFP